MALTIKQTNKNEINLALTKWLQQPYLSHQGKQQSKTDYLISIMIHDTLASSASFNLKNLVLASRTHLVLRAPRWPPRPHLGLHGLIWS